MLAGLLLFTRVARNRLLVAKRREDEECGLDGSFVYI